MNSTKVKKCHCFSVRKGRDNMNKVCATCNGSGLLKEVTTVTVTPYNPDWFRGK